MSQVFLSETQNKNNQGKKRGLFISGPGLSAQPYLKQPCVKVSSVISCKFCKQCRFWIGQQCTTT